jgi:CBS domain containing-hemolysin-like protein
MATPDSSAPPATQAATTPAEGERPSSPGKPLLTEIGARLAHAVRNLRGSSSIRESLEEVIEESERETQELSTQERLMLGNLLKFGDLRVEDVMVPRADIVAVEENTPLTDLITLFREAQHSRLPIYRETLDDPIGMIHIKDVIALTEKDDAGTWRFRDASIQKLKREVLYVPGAMPALDLLLKMQASHIHMALVVDEYGGTDGLVSIEDLVEEIVGDIDDEHDVDEEPLILPRGDGSFVADARIDLEDFKTRTGIDLTQARSDEDVDTLGGLVFAELGRVPVRGEIVAIPAGFEFEVLDADPRRVKRLAVRPVAPAPAVRAP